ncbi:MAG: hypothetical protein LBK94_00770 [Prevotellaceae bacterium]|jgi:hypothetical protein|nr:hypothetical protein [Prevotellaceae bacterium]
MAVLKWGKPKIEIAKILAGGTLDDWTTIDTPKQETSELATEAGNKVEALEEGGGIVDVRYDKNKYTFTFQLFAKSGTSKPIADVDGVILDNYAVRLTPEDDALPGFIMDKTNVTVITTWNTTDGELWQYTFEGLVPATGAILKPYVYTP